MLIIFQTLVMYESLNNPVQYALDSPHFAESKTESEKHYYPCPKSHSKWMVEPSFDPDWP